MIVGAGGPDFVVELKVRDHTLVSGLPPKLGGQDEGPDAHELLEAALTACTIQTVHMYAQRKGFELTCLFVEVKIESEGAESLLRRKIRFEGNLSEQEQTRLFEIAERCPIHRLLESKITIHSEMVSSSSS